MARDRGREGAAGHRRGGLARIARRLALGAALAASAAAYAATATGSFHVRVELFTEDKTLPCIGANDGDDVKIDCGAATDRARPSPQRVLQVFLNNHRLANVDTTLTTGTVTSWRVVKSEDHEYVEILVGW